jgi:hypothetical protein
VIATVSNRTAAYCYVARIDRRHHGCRFGRLTFCSRRIGDFGR